jgi:hypothetical protein
MMLLNMQHTNNLVLVMKWREAIEKEDFVESKNYTRNYMGFDKISQKELDSLCRAANEGFKLKGSNLRVANHMGEVCPIYKKEEA